MEANYLMVVRLRKLPNKRMQLTVDSATRSVSRSLASLSTGADPWRWAAEDKQLIQRKLGFFFQE
jgi:hypothetical protein